MSFSVLTSGQWWSVVRQRTGIETFSDTVMAHASTKMLSSDTHKSVDLFHTQACVLACGRLTGVWVCTSPCFECVCAPQMLLRVSVSVVQSIIQLLTLSRPPEPLLSLPLKMHPFPRPSLCPLPVPTRPLCHTHKERAQCRWDQRTLPCFWCWTHPPPGDFKLPEVTDG